jgi:hypothetical protein
MQRDGLEVKPIKNYQFLQLLIQVLIKGRNGVNIAVIFVVPTRTAKMQGQ